VGHETVVVRGMPVTVVVRGMPVLISRVSGQADLCAIIAICFAYAFMNGEALRTGGMKAEHIIMV